MSEICSWNINGSVQSQNSLLLLFLLQNDYSIRIAGNFGWCKFSCKAFRINFRMCACGNATPTSLASTCVFDVIKISNVKLFVDFIFVRRGIIRNIRKFAPIQKFPLYSR